MKTNIHLFDVDWTLSHMWDNTVVMINNKWNIEKMSPKNSLQHSWSPLCYKTRNDVSNEVKIKRLEQMWREYFQNENWLYLPSNDVYNMDDYIHVPWLETIHDSVSWKLLLSMKATENHCWQEAIDNALHFMWCFEEEKDDRYLRWKWNFMNEFLSSQAIEAAIKELIIAINSWELIIVLTARGHTSSSIKNWILKYCEKNRIYVNADYFALCSFQWVYSYELLDNDTIQNSGTSWRKIHLTNNWIEKLENQWVMIDKLTVHEDEEEYLSIYSKPNTFNVGEWNVIVKSY